jgi:exodeoxyribonuclease V gamma subunit
VPSSSLPSGLIVIHSNLSESLRDVLVSWMRNHPLAPLEQEVVLVQSSGIAQWLKLALAADVDDAAPGGGAGIAASIDFLLPSRFLWRAYRAVLGSRAVPEVSPFDKPRLMWRLLRLLPQVMAQAVYAPLQRFLKHDDDCRKRYQLAERLADLFDQYQVYRADWLAAWARGDDTLPRDAGDSRPLPETQRWQAALWRALLDDVKTHARPDADTPSSDGRAAVHAAFMRHAEQLGPDARVEKLPRRIVVFGISTLPRQSLEVLATLARWTQVVMCVNNPCEHYWSDIIEGKELLRATHARQSRRQGSPAQIGEDALHLHAHPLLAAWGKQGRDFIGLLDEHDSQAARASVLSSLGDQAQRFDLFASAGVSSLLRQLQDDIRDLRPLRETREHWPAVDTAADASVRFHIAHSRQREVEILHDQLLAAFDEDAGLRARDVIVMVPDIEAYAPHIQAVFGLHDAADSRAIAYTIADRGKRHVDPLLHVLEQLLQISRSRFSVSDFMDLLEVPAVRNRFGIGEDQLPLLHTWIRGVNIRWGLHDEQRQTLGLPAAAAGAAQNTWLFGLRRIVLGYAVGAKGDSWNGIEPYDDIGGLDAALLGPMVDLIDTLERSWRLLGEPAAPAQWGERLQDLLQAFFLPEETGDAYTLQRLTGALQDWLEICDEAGVTEALPLSAVGEHWLSQLDDSGLSQRFFGGAITFATLMPMRAIPFRMVCLLGMNDGDYPRVRIPMDFDLMGGDYRPGDRSRREDDRYLFLEAVLSARDRLYISWVGRSVRDNTPRPPSVLVGQLRDHLNSGWRMDEAGEPDLMTALTTEHRLQPFSRDYFPSDPYASPLFTYAREWQGDATRKIVPAVAALTPQAREEPLTLRELADFLKAPVDAFFKQRLQVNFSSEDPTTEDVEPFAPDPLEQWTLQDVLIKAQARALEAGEDPQVSRDAALARISREGVLAAGAFGELAAIDLAAPLDDMMERYRVALDNWPNVVAGEQPLTFTLSPRGGSPLVLADWLGGLRANEQGAYCRLLLDSSSLIPKGKYRAARVAPHWVGHVAAQLSGVPVTTLVVSKAGSIELAPVPLADARSYLAAWLSAWWEGMCRPLPLAVATAFEWLTRRPPQAGMAFGQTASSQPASSHATSGGAEAEAAAETQAHSVAHGAARKVYEGSGDAMGEVDASPYLQSAYPDFAALSGSGEFFILAETLLRPMRAALYADKKAAGPTPAFKEAGHE